MCSFYTKRGFKLAAERDPLAEGQLCKDSQVPTPRLGELLHLTPPGDQEVVNEKVRLGLGKLALALGKLRGKHASLRSYAS